MTRGSWLWEHLVGHYPYFAGLFNTCTLGRCVEWQGVCNMVKFGMRKKIRNHPHLKTKKERRDLTNNAGQCPANKSSTAEFSTLPGRRALFRSSLCIHKTGLNLMTDKRNTCKTLQSDSEVLLADTVNIYWLVILRSKSFGTLRVVFLDTQLRVLTTFREAHVLWQAALPYLRWFYQLMNKMCLMYVLNSMGSLFSKAPFFSCPFQIAFEFSLLLWSSRQV